MNAHQRHLKRNYADGGAVRTQAQADADARSGNVGDDVYNKAAADRAQAAVPAKTAPDSKNVGFSRAPQSPAQSAQFKALLNKQTQDAVKLRGSK